MSIKYQCPKCGKRFIEWGAEKVDFKCTECEGQELLRVGRPESDKKSKAAKAPSLRRGKKKKKKKAAAAPPPPKIEVPEEGGTPADEGPVETETPDKKPAGDAKKDASAAKGKASKDAPA